MALPNDLDICMALEELKLNANRWELSSPVPPHTITEWDSNNSDSQPSEAELINAWNTYKTRTGGPDMGLLRDERNIRLQETDWRANTDLTMSDDWKNYRQALRDLPANTSDPKNPTWPTPPL